MSEDTNIEKKLIEDSLPLKTLGEYAQKEKPAVPKTLSGLHLWWARRPLTMTRAVIASCLLSAPITSKEREEVHLLLKKSCTLDAGQLEVTRQSSSKICKINSDLKMLITRIKEKNDVKNIKLLDPFAGGGSIPFEALRIGLDVTASDLNSVTYLIRETGLNLIPKTNLKEVKHPITNKKVIMKTDLENKVKKWGSIIIDRTHKELKELFEDNTLYYIWVKTCHCKTCGNKIPLHSIQFVQGGRKPPMGVFLEVNDKEKSFSFSIKPTDEENPPSPRLRDRKGVTCPFCKARTTSLNDVKAEAIKVGLEYYPICKIVLDREGKRIYAPFSNDDLERERKAKALLEKKISKSGMKSFVPNEPAPETGSGAKRGFSNSLYGYTTFNKFFSPRQALLLGTIAENIRNAYPEILKDIKNEKSAKTIMILLSFTLNRVANYNSYFSAWQKNFQKIAPMYSTPTLKMTWDFTEANTFTPGSGSWVSSALPTTLRAISSCSIFIESEFRNFISSATNTELESETFDLVITDPPYFDYIGYSDLSDFFYVWLKRTIEDLFPEAFKGLLTSKENELILYEKSNQAEIKLEEGLLKTWQEAYRVLKPKGMLVVMFTHKSTSAWEQLFQTLQKAGFYATATWPILTELPTKLLQNRANVNTTLIVVCRKHSTLEQTTGTFKSVKTALIEKIKEKCLDFWNLDMYGSDFFVASIGPAMEVFAKYSKVIKTSGEIVNVGELIEFTREIVSNVVLEKLLSETGTTLDHRSRVFVLWRWAYLTAITDIDDLLTFLKGVGGERAELENEKRIEIQGSKVSVLGPFERENDLIWEDSEKWEINLPLIDQLHIACLLREKGSFIDYEKYLDFLSVLSQPHHPFWILTRSLVEILQPLRTPGKGKGKVGSRELDAYRKVLENIPSVDLHRERLKQRARLDSFLNKGDN